MRCRRPPAESRPARLLRRLAEAPSPSVVEPFVREQARLLKAHPVTVYRFLGELLAAHVLQQVTVAGRRAVILSCRSANWLVCARCGVLRPLPEPEVMPEWKAQIARGTGFLVDHHWCEANGLCPQCQNSSPT